MALKLINATEVRSGTTINVDGQPCTARSNDISKTGKHGHAKCRIEAIGIFDGKKRVLAVPGHERFEVPLIEKKKGQVLSVDSDSKKASVMDLESFETIDVPFESDIEGQLEPDKQVEYWVIEDKKAIRRVM